MKTVLVLAQHPDLPEAARAALPPGTYRVLHRTDAKDSLPLLANGFIDACIIDADLAHVQTLWTVEEIRRQAPHCPIIVYASAGHRDWEEEAYLGGASFVLNKPLKGRLIVSLLDRPASPSVRQASSVGIPAPQPPAPGTSRDMDFPALEALRRFSGVLTHSLKADSLIHEFLLSLRQILHLNRATIFLQPAPGVLGGEQHSLRAVSAIGLDSGLLQHIELSTSSGIAAYLARHGRILQRHSPEAQANQDILKEFDVLGVELAVPVLDREKMIGVALFGGRITGEGFASAELTLLFHLLEELALGIKNIWLHDQLAGSHELLTDVLRQMSNAFVVVNRDLTVAHVNKAARQVFGRAGRRPELDFSDLPQLLGSKIYQALQTGSAITPFKHHLEEPARKTLQITIIPLQRPDSAQPHAVMMMAEDLTQSEQLQRLEIEATNLRLVRTMADRLAHEIGNAMVPLSTHQQLLADKYRDPEFRASLDQALAEGVKRVTRLVNQMRFLARDTLLGAEQVSIPQLLDEAFQDALKHLPLKSASLKQKNPAQPVMVSGEKPALKHALSEIILNALQANTTEPKIEIHSSVETDHAGQAWLHIDVHDNGGGFSQNALKHVPEPFFTTRNVGLGLGLTVSQKILQTHHGKLTLSGLPNGKHGVVRVSLPLKAEERK